MQSNVLYRRDLLIKAFQGYFQKVNRMFKSSPLPPSSSISNIVRTIRCLIYLCYNYYRTELIRFVRSKLSRSRYKPLFICTIKSQFWFRSYPAQIRLKPLCISSIKKSILFLHIALFISFLGPHLYGLVQ